MAFIFKKGKIWSSFHSFTTFNQKWNDCHGLIIFKYIQPKPGRNFIIKMYGPQMSLGISVERSERKREIRNFIKMGHTVCALFSMWNNKNLSMIDAFWFLYKGALITKTVPSPISKKNGDWHFHDRRRDVTLFYFSKSKKNQQQRTKPGSLVIWPGDEVIYYYHIHNELVTPLVMVVTCEKSKTVEIRWGRKTFRYLFGLSPPYVCVCGL
jgi:hypothetical protein